MEEEVAAVEWVVAVEEEGEVLVEGDSEGEAAAEEEVVVEVSSRKLSSEYDSRHFLAPKHKKKSF